MADLNVQIKPGLAPELGHHDGKAVAKLDRTATLIQNDTNSYKFVPRHIAEDMVKAHKAVIITAAKHGAEYIKAIRLALGKVEDFAPGEMIQICGKAMRPEQIGLLDTEAIIKKAEAELESVDKMVESAEGDSAVTAAMLKDPEAFKNKTENERPWQHRA